MRVPLTVLLCAALSTGAAYAQKAEPEFVRDAIGVRSYPPAPRLSERKATLSVATIASAAAGAADQLEAMREWNRQGRRPLRNGFTRSIGEPIAIDLAAAATSKRFPSLGITELTPRGSIIWSGSVKVDGAHRLRLHLTNVDLPAGTTFWSYGAGEEPIAYGMELVDASGSLYAPSTRGEVAYIEIEVPGAEKLTRASFRIADLVEIVPPNDDSLATLGIQPNDSPDCLIDATCVTNATLDVVAEYRRAVAHLEIISGGSSGVCTGALMNDQDSSSFIPYFLTANHCLSTQAEATTIEAFWDYKTSTCGGTFPDKSTLQRTNGSQMLATSASTDFAFLRMNSVPSGRVFLGWNPSASAVPAGTRIHRISHPYPDAFVQPAAQAYSSTIVETTSSACDGYSRPNYIYSTRSQGGVYGGSSGSPVILAGGYVVGQLLGACGPAPSEGCNSSNKVVDGALSVTFPSIAQYLSNSSQPTQCVPNSTTACMLNNRFQVKVRYRGTFDHAPADRDALVKSVTGFASPNFETAFFYFNSENNIEMLVKLLDQGNVDSQNRPTIAVLFGSATPLRVELTITDTKTGATKNYVSEFPKMQGATDFTAFVK